MWLIYHVFLSIPDKKLASNLAYINIQVTYTTHP